MARSLKKFTVVLNTDRGYFDLQVKANDPLEAKIKAKNDFAHGDCDDEDWHESSAVVISGWPETWLGD